MQIRLRSILLLVGCIIAFASNLFILNDADQFKLLITFLIILGVPHGALDLYIENKSIEQIIPENGKVLQKYLLNIVFYAALWYLSPLISLVFFIFITAYHFGEIDWNGKSETLIHRVTYVFLGLCWIVYFLSKNIDAAKKIFLYLGDKTVTESSWINIAHSTSIISLSLIVGMYGMLFVYKKYFFYTSKDFYFSLLQMITLMIICNFSQLWIGFGFYFGLWHSILSFDKIRLHFELKNDRKNWISLLKLAMPFSLMAWIGMLFVMFMFFNSKNQTSLITLLFITLSVLTLPHLQVFTKLKIKRTN